MSLAPLPRPRNLDDVHALILLIAERIERVVNGQLEQAQQIGHIAATVARLELAKPYRDPEASWHDFDPQVQEFRAILRERVQDRRDPMDSDRARAIAEKAVQSAKDREGAEALQAWHRRFWTVALMVTGGTILAVLGYVARWLIER